MATQNSSVDVNPVQPPIQQQQPPPQEQPHQQPPQVYIPYQQQPFQPGHLPQPMPQQWTPPEPPKNKAWDLTKIILHASSILISIIALALTFSLAGVESVGTILLVCSPVLFASLIWSASELITRRVRKNRRGIHPGAHVALSLLIWLGAAFVGGMETSFVSLFDESYDRPYVTCYSRDSGRAYRCRDRESTGSYYDGKRGQFWAVAIFTLFIWLIHFILFVGACVDTHRRNASKRQIMVVGGGYWNQGWQPMQGNTASQDIPMVNQVPQDNKAVTEFYR